jgi:type IV fimbrial biogenesis protein FimT
MTLIELVVVLVLVLAMAMAAMPSVQVWIRNTEIRNVATSIQAGMQRARAEAMRRNERVTFSLVSLSANGRMDDSCAVKENGSSWVVSLDEPGGQCGARIGDTAAAPRLLDAHATGVKTGAVEVLGTASNDGDAAQLIFDGFGRVAGPANSIAIVDITSGTAGDDFRDLRIMVGSGGTVRMCEPKIAKGGTDPRAC